MTLRGEPLATITVDAVDAPAPAGRRDADAEWCAHLADVLARSGLPARRARRGLPGSHARGRRRVCVAARNRVGPAFTARRRDRGAGPVQIVSRLARSANRR